MYDRHLRFDALVPQNLFALANLAVRAALKDALAGLETARAAVARAST